MYNLETIRNRCDLLLQQAIADNDEKKIRSFETLNEALKDDDYLINNKMVITSRILDILKFNLKECSKIIDYLVHKDDEKVLLEFVSIFGDFMQIETIVNSKIEKCYKFKNGFIFKHNTFLNRYYFLSGDKWLLDNSISGMVSDFRYSYERLYEKKKNNVNTR